MQSTRRSQPYKKGSGLRAPGGALTAMLRGKPAFLTNPSHTGSLSQQVQRRRKRKTKRHVKPQGPMPMPLPGKML